MRPQYTLLFLGAGTSSPYGFPLGKSLMADVAAALRDFAVPIVRERRTEGMALLKLADAVDLCGQPSIDDYIHLKEGTSGWIKAAVVRVLLEYESKAADALTRKPPRDDLAGYIFQQILRNEVIRAERSLRIITLNYDRSLEHSFLTKLMNSHDLEDWFAADLLAKHLPILHLHGQLGELVGESEICLPFGDIKRVVSFEKLGEGLGFVNETVSLDATYERAREWISGANSICFLGFGYHSKVLRRLGSDCFKGKPVKGSAFELPLSELAAAESFFYEATTPNIDRGGLTSVKYLREVGGV